MYAVIDLTTVKNIRDLHEYINAELRQRRREPRVRAPFFYV